MNSQKGNMAVVVPILLVVAIVGGYFGFRALSDRTADESEEMGQIMEKEEGEGMMESDGMMEDEGAMMKDEMGEGDSMMGDGMMSQVREFVVSGTPFKFSAGEMRVKKGEKVRIVFTNEQGMHDWVVDEFNARTKVLQAGQSETIEFVADKTGTFEYYCSVGTHRQMGMKGNLIVE